MKESIVYLAEAIATRAKAKRVYAEVFDADPYADPLRAELIRADWDFYEAEDVIDRIESGNWCNW